MPGQNVTPAVVEAWEKKTGIKIGSGDVLILKSKQRGSDNNMRRRLGSPRCFRG